MKNKILYASSFTLAVALLASCAKSDESMLPESQDQEVTITVNLPDATRVGMDGVDVYWEEGDEMLFYGNNSTHGANLSQLTTNVTTLKLTEKTNTTATFTGALNGTVTADTDSMIAGIYPGHEAFVNYGTNANMYYSSLRVIQPTYFQYTYTDGDLDPGSIGDYCFMHFSADQQTVTNATELTGEVSHLMAYVDFNLENSQEGKKVQKVFFHLDEPLTYPSMKVSKSGACTMDMYVDYILSASGTEEDYAKVVMDYMVVELTDSATGSFGVSANSDGIIPVRIPMIPQHIVGDWNVHVLYDDGSEDIVTVTYPLVILAAGKVYNMDCPIDLSGSSVQHLEKATPKIGDYYYGDGEYSSIYDPTKLVSASTLGIVYQLIGRGVDTKIGKAYAAVAGASAKVLNTTTFTDYGSGGIISTAVADNSGLVNVSQLAEYGRVYAMARDNVNLDENSTIKEVCDLMYPAFSATMARNGDIEAMEFDGTETGVWYIPSSVEVYRFTTDMITMQGLRVLFHNQQLARLPSDVTGTSGYLATVVNGATGNYQHLSSTIGTTFAWRYVRQRPFHTFDPGSTGYIISYTSGATSASQYRPILQVNVESED